MNTSQVITAETIHDKAFDRLLEHVVYTTGEGRDVVGCKAKWQRYEIDFYWNEDGLFVECFGFMRGKNWVECEPTDFQKTQMDKVISKRLDALEEAEAREEARAREELEAEDTYSFYGVNPAMFIR